MGARRRNLFILLFVVGLMLASAVAIASKPTRLGLDLRGGIELVLQGRPTPQQPEVDSAAIDRAIDLIRDGCDQLGVAEIEIARLGSDQISVGIPGATSVGRTTECATKPARLFFYDWEPNVIGKPGSPQPAEDPFSNIYDAVRLASKQKAECDGCTSGPRYYLFEEKPPHRLIAGPESARSDLFITATGRKRPHKGIVVRVPRGTLVTSGTPQADPVCTSKDCYFVLHDRPSLSGSDLKDPKQEFDPSTNQPNVTFGFTDSGRGKFQDVTREIAQRGAANALPGENPAAASDHFAVVLDNEVVSRPIINYAENPDGIDGRTGAQISGDFTSGQAQDLAEFLKRGALQIDLKLISQSQISASLGKEALDQGLKAAIIGLILVILFLIAYYRFLGVVATLGLAVFAVIFFALVKLIPITLTLPGIAGLILTIGVAADANVVIFERIKEEARAGRSLSSAIAAGYGRGIATIIDANVITFLTAFILFVLATSGVKGFALTLGLGTIASLLTAVVFTQAFLGVFGRGRVLNSRWMLGAPAEQRTRWHFDFTGLSRYFFSMSGIILTVGALSLAINQLNFGIDFESGTRIEASLSRAASVEDVRNTLSREGLGGAEIQAIENPALGSNAFQIESSQLRPAQISNVQDTLNQRFGVAPDAFDSISIGPTFGETIARSAAMAIIFSLLVISGYIALRFEAKYAVPVLIAVAHDVLITAGVYSLFGREVTSATVAAFLTILGYSLYDTIIVFDRIRENVPRMPRAAFSQIVNRSMSEVLTRSLITGLSSVFLVTVLLIFGGETLKDFAFAMMVGIASGTYSSIFIASPVLTAWKEREDAFRGRRKRIEDAMGEVPAFAEEIAVAKLNEAPAETELEPEEPAPAEPEPEPEPVAVEPDRVSPSATEPEPEGLGAGEARAERRDKPAKRRRQRQRRRKHGRPR
ncbi:MAG: protein translocase subunit SecD [Actinomycetota bacterium]